MQQPVKRTEEDGLKAGQHLTGFDLLYMRFLLNKNGSDSEVLCGETYGHSNGRYRVAMMSNPSNPLRSWAKIGATWCHASLSDQWWKAINVPVFQNKKWRLAEHSQPWKMAGGITGWHPMKPRRQERETE